MITIHVVPSAVALFSGFAMLASFVNKEDRVPVICISLGMMVMAFFAAYGMGAFFELL